jgi:four helix bundle protein
MRMENEPRDISERTFSFALDIVRICQNLIVEAGVTRTLGRQLLRSGTSIGANMEEAQAAQSSADFVSKCSIALKESRETIYWLRLIHASGCANGNFELSLKEADEISRIIASIIVRTRNGTKRK